MEIVLVVLRNACTLAYPYKQRYLLFVKPTFAGKQFVNQSRIKLFLQYIVE